jgi:hypothetical protein
MYYIITIRKHLIWYILVQQDAFLEDYAARSFSGSGDVKFKKHLLKVMFIIPEQKKI